MERSQRSSPFIGRWPEGPEGPGRTIHRSGRACAGRDRLRRLPGPRRRLVPEGPRRPRGRGRSAAGPVPLGAGRDRTAAPGRRHRRARARLLRHAWRPPAWAGEPYAGARGLWARARDRADRHRLDEPLPWILLQLAKGQRDACLLRVELDHLDGDLLAQLEDIGDLGHTVPGKLGDVDEAVRTADVDERAVAGDSGDGALHRAPGLQPAEELLALARAVLVLRRLLADDQ